MEDYLINNGTRYSISINDYFHESGYVVYVADILDQCFDTTYKLYFRYKNLKNIHEKLSKIQKIEKILPEFPKTRSILFFQRTNRNTKDIADRSRQLEYYLTKIINDQNISKQKQVKQLLNKAKYGNMKRKCKSQDKPYKYQGRKSSTSLQKKQNSLGSLSGSRMTISLL